MVFSSLVFLCIFFPAVLILYHLCPFLKGKNAILLLASLVFYAWGEPKWIVVMLITTLIDYSAGVVIGKAKGKGVKKLALVLSVVVTLGFLVVFKYLNFFTSNLNLILPVEIPQTNLVLPIGISFYTFQALSYVIDVYRGEVDYQKNYFNLLLYVSMFPQLIAGPIVRYVDVASEIATRKVNFTDFSGGITKFLIGLTKKAVLANFVGELAENYLSGDIQSLSVLGAWTGIIAYFFQIYFDFSGYSDMAIGIGKMLGFTFRENFNYPYISLSITDFWRRWHMSLSSFFRDYVYIPLGGNRRFQLRNMFVVWLLTGFWHGASWNFVIWGLYYFVMLALEKYVYGKFLEKLPKIFRRIYSVFIVIIGWVFFYFEDMKSIKYMFGAMFGVTDKALYMPTDTTTLTNNVFLLVVCVIAVTPLLKNIGDKLQTKLNQSPNGVIVNGVLTFAFQAAVLLLCAACLVGSTYNPFLYFRF